MTQLRTKSSTSLKSASGSRKVVERASNTSTTSSSAIRSAGEYAKNRDPSIVTSSNNANIKQPSMDRLLQANQRHRRTGSSNSVTSTPLVLDGNSNNNNNTNSENSDKKLNSNNGEVGISPAEMIANRIASYAEKCRGMRYKNKDISGSVPKARAAGDADNSAPTEWPVFPTYPPTTSPMGPSETTIPKTRMRHYRSRSSITMGGSNLKYEVTPQNISSRSSSYTRIPNLFGHVDSSQDGNSDNYGQPSRQRQLQPVPSEDSLQGSPIHADTANVKQENSGTIGVRLTESVSSPLMTKVSNISGGSGSSSSNDCDVGGNAELRKRLVRSAAEKHSYHHRPRSATRLAISPAPRKHSLPCSTEQWSRSGRKGHSRSLTPSSSASAIIQLLQNNREGLSPQGTRGQDSSLRSHRSPSISRTVAMKSLNHTLYKPSQLFEVKSPPPATTNIQYHHQQFIGARDITPYVSTTPISKSTSAQAMLGRSYSRRHSRNNSGGSTISNLSNYGHVRSNSASSLGTDAERDRGGGSNSRVPNSSIVATKRQTIDPRSSANPLLDKPEQYALSLLKPNTSTRVKNPTTTTMVDSSNGQSQDIVKSLSEGSVYQVPKTKRSDSKTVIDVQDTDDDDECFYEAIDQSPIGSRTTARIDNSKKTFDHSSPSDKQKHILSISVDSQKDNSFTIQQGQSSNNSIINTDQEKAVAATPAIATIISNNASTTANTLSSFTGLFKRRRNTSISTSNSASTSYFDAASSQNLPSPPIVSPTKLDSSSDNIPSSQQQLVVDKEHLAKTTSSPPPPASQPATRTRSRSLGAVFSGANILPTARLAQRNAPLAIMSPPSAAPNDPRMGHKSSVSFSARLTRSPSINQPAKLHKRSFWSIFRSDDNSVANDDTSAVTAVTQGSQSSHQSVLPQPAAADRNSQANASNVATKKAEASTTNKNNNTGLTATAADTHSGTDTNYKENNVPNSTNNNNSSNVPQKDVAKTTSNSINSNQKKSTSNNIAPRIKSPDFGDTDSVQVSLDNLSIDEPDNNTLNAQQQLQQQQVQHLSPLMEGPDDHVSTSYPSDGENAEQTHIIEGADTRTAPNSVGQGSLSRKYGAVSAAALSKSNKVNGVSSGPSPHIRPAIAGYGNDESSLVSPLTLPSMSRLMGKSGNSSSTMSSTAVNVSSPVKRTISMRARPSPLNVNSPTSQTQPATSAGTNTQRQATTPLAATCFSSPSSGIGTTGGVLGDGPLSSAVTNDMDPLSPEGILHRKAKAVGMALFYLEESDSSDTLDLIPDGDLVSEDELPRLNDHAEWLGKPAPLNKLALKYYMDMYDFTKIRIDEGLRMVCGHILLKGESQVIDRILYAFAQRHQECNPTDVLRGVDVAHAVSYSTLLLNTDLHIANIRSSERMSKSRFVRNTMDTISQFGGILALDGGRKGSRPATLRTASQSSFSSSVIARTSGGTSRIPPQLPELNLASPTHPQVSSFGDSECKSPPITASPYTSPPRNKNREGSCAVSFREGAEPADNEDDSTSSPLHENGENTSDRFLSNVPSSSLSFDQPHPPRSMSSALGTGILGQSRSSRDIHRLISFRSKRFSMLDGITDNSSIHGHSGGSSGGGVVSAGVLVSGLTKSFKQLRRKVSQSSSSNKNGGNVMVIEGSGNTAFGQGNSAVSRASDAIGLGIGELTGANASNYIDSDSASVVAIQAAATASQKLRGGHGQLPRAMSTIDMRDITTLLKDIYSSIKHNPLSQPAFARSSTANLSHTGTNASKPHSNSFFPRASMTLREAPFLGRRSSVQAAPVGSSSILSTGGRGLARQASASKPMDGGRAKQQLYPSRTGSSSITESSTASNSNTNLSHFSQQQRQPPHGFNRANTPSVRSIPLQQLGHSRSDASLAHTASAGMGESSGGFKVRGTIQFRPAIKHGGGGGAAGSQRLRNSPSRSSGFYSNNAFGASGNLAQMESATGVMGGFSSHTSPYLHSSSYSRSAIENMFIRSGMLERKHLYERTNKKASNRSWRKCYVSVDRGTVAMFKVEDKNGGGQPDGRELTDTSMQLGTVSLRHTMTQVLPPPGYNKRRPLVFALQLPNGGVYLFQTQDQEDLHCWVDSCNYWASRESKTPYMIGGVFNMEYGWDNTGDYVKRQEEKEQREEQGETFSETELRQDAIRVQTERESNRTRNIVEWTPPNNPMQRSEVDDASQLRILLHHITYLEEDLVSHKKLMGSIDERFFPRTPQHQKAFQNWERKAQYILKELIKYQTYADCLQKALEKVEEVINAANESTNNAHMCTAATATSVSAVVSPQPSTMANDDCFGTIDSGTEVGYYGAGPNGTGGSRVANYPPLPPTSGVAVSSSNRAGSMVNGPGVLEKISEYDGSQTQFSGPESRKASVGTTGSISDHRKYGGQLQHRKGPMHRASHNDLPPPPVPPKDNRTISNSKSYNPVLVKGVSSGGTQQQRLSTVASSNTIYESAEADLTTPNNNESST